MPQNSITVMASVYAEFFGPHLAQRGLDPGAIRVLPKPTARAFWETRFGRGSTRYFNLPDGVWIDRDEWTIFGDWEAALKSPSAAKTMIAQLTRRLDWTPDTALAYCISRTQVLKTTWQVFQAIWPAFLESECDSPLLVPTTPTVPGIVQFLADGRIRVSTAVQDGQT